MTEGSDVDVVDPGSCACDGTVHQWDPVHDDCPSEAVPLIDGREPRPLGWLFRGRLGRSAGPGCALVPTARRWASWSTGTGRSTP